jgi:hypothetical protein
MAGAPHSRGGRGADRPSQRGSRATSARTGWRALTALILLRALLRDLDLAGVATALPRPFRPDPRRARGAETSRRHGGHRSSHHRVRFDQEALTHVGTPRSSTFSRERPVIG